MNFPGPSATTPAGYDPPHHHGRRKSHVGDDVPLTLDGVEVQCVRVADLFA